MAKPKSSFKNFRVKKSSPRSRHNAWLEKFDELFKRVQPLLVLGTFAFGIWQYSDTKEKEFKRAFFDERLKTYAELVDVASQIAISSPNSPEQAVAVKNFWRLNFGKAPFIADREVEEAKRRMANYIVYCIEKKGPAPYKEFCQFPSENASALNIASAARNSLISTYSTPLIKLDEGNLYLPAHMNLGH